MKKAIFYFLLGTLTLEGALFTACSRQDDPFAIAPGTARRRPAGRELRGVPAVKTEVALIETPGPRSAVQDSLLKRYDR